MAIDERTTLFPGVPITLGDGRQVRLTYSMESLARIEERFGGLGAVRAALAGELEGVSQFRAIIAFIAAGLLHEPDPAGAWPSVGEDPGLSRMLPVEHLQAYTDAAQRAFGNAFPGSSGEAPGPSRAARKPAGAAKRAPAKRATPAKRAAARNAAKSTTARKASSGRGASGGPSGSAAG